MLGLTDKTRSCLGQTSTRRQHLRLGLYTVFSLAVTSIIYLTLRRSDRWPSAFSFSFSSHHTWETPTPASPLPHIPKKIWQIALPTLTPEIITAESITSFITHSPSHAYTALDASGARSLLTHVATTTTPANKYADIHALYDAIPRTVMRADFLRYLVLASEGGVYSDADTVMVRGLAHWVPDEFKNRTRLVVGIEADAGREGKMVPGTRYRVQFCQWTMAGAQGHPVFWRMVDRILGAVREYEVDGWEGFSDWDVLEVGGPVGWSEVVYGYLSEVVGTDVAWTNLTGLREPRMFGDVLVLPIDGFATGVWHSGASKVGANREGTMVLHSFKGSWKKKGWWPW